MFTEPYMVRAFLAALLLAPLCAFLGVFVTARRMSFFSDTIAHGALAGVALGDVDRASVREHVPVDRVFRPDAGSRREYERLYAEFPKLYKAQKKMFRRLNRRG